MGSFGREYAAIYDALYQHKAYAHEAGVAANIIRALKPDARYVLDYGCGTGNYAGHLAEHGFHVYGLDPNEDLLAQARRKLAHLSQARFSPLAAREAIPPASIDAIVALFDVLSYLTQNDELDDFLSYAHRTLAPDGVLVFDFWYGPAVIHLVPERRFNEYPWGEKRILRWREPHHDLAAGEVSISNTVMVLQGERVLQELQDDHRLRYFFPKEIDAFLRHHQFDLRQLGTWESPDGPPSLADWSVLATAVRR